MSAVLASVSAYSFPLTPALSGQKIYYINNILKIKGKLHAPFSLDCFFLLRDFPGNRLETTVPVGWALNTNN